MRVLHLLDHAALRPSDYRRRSLALLGQLRAQGVQTVHLAGPPPMPARSATGPGPAPAPAPQGLHFYRTAAPWPACARAQGLAPLAALGVLGWRLRRLARLTRPDLIHVHAPARHALAALPVARLARLPLVVELERRAGAAGKTAGQVADPAADAQRGPLATLVRWALPRADALAAGSLEQRALLLGQGWTAGRIAVMPAAPDLEPAPAALETRRPAGLEDAPLIAYAGRLACEEGLDLLLAVLPALRRRFPALRLLVAGGGAREDELGEWTRAPGLRGHVAVTGKLGSRRTADLLARADIAVFPVLPGAHALLPSRHLLNAMALGCAIVASDLPCHRDLLEHGRSGILFGAGSAAALLDALLRLLAEPARLPALGRAAAGFVASERSWAASAARYRRLYAAVLADHGRERGR